MRRTKRFVAMMAVLVGAAIVTTTAFGQTRIDVNNPGTGGSGYEVNGGVIRIAQNGEYTLTGTTTANRVVVGAGVTATVTLENVSITSNIASPFELNNTGCNVVLKLVGNNSLTANPPDTDGEDRFCAAVQVEGNAGVTIEGNGSLTANGGVCGAGIGSGLIEHADMTYTTMTTGTITIKSGTVNAHGGLMGAGIGGGYNAIDGVINISGGNITATSGGQSVGIGGGFGSSGITINISGGNINAAGGGYAAGIGGGPYGSGGNITINGGVLLAIGGEQAASIGGGYYGAAGNIRISGGSIFAWCTQTAFGEGAGIGGGEFGTSEGSISIEGGNIVTDHIGISGGYSDILTPTTVSNGAIIAGSINTTSFGSASVITGVDITEALVRTMFANTPIIVSEGEDESDTIIIERPGNTVYLHDTTTVTITDPAVIIHDTLRDFTEVRDTAYFTYNIHDTTYVRDTIYKDRIVHDTLRLTLRDTVIDYITLPVRETIELPAFYDVYTIVNNVTGDESPVEDTRIDLVPVSGDEDMFYLHGIQQNTPFAIYDSSGALVLKAGKMPMQITASGVFIVAQSGKYYKFVK